MKISITEFNKVWFEAFHERLLDELLEYEQNFNDPNYGLYYTVPQYTSILSTVGLISRNRKFARKFALSFKGIWRLYLYKQEKITLASMFFEGKDIIEMHRVLENGI